MMANVIQDLRFALRSLRKAPLFTAVAVLSLALGIGANTAIFSLINQVLLELLPVKNPRELVLLTTRGSHYGSNTGSNSLSYPMYQDIRDRNQVFSGIFCRHATTVSLAVDGATELATGELVSGNYFTVLGVGAALGRVFTHRDDLIQGGHPVAVLSYGFWKSRFAGDPGVIGRRILVNGYPFTVVGVNQAGFVGVEPDSSPQIRIPMTMKDVVMPDSLYLLNKRRGRFAQVFGRLKPGTTLEHAKAGLQPLFHQILEMEVRQQDFAKTSEFTRQQFLKSWLDVLPAAKGRSFLRTRFEKPLLALMAIVALVLLIACSNVANLLIARANARQKEIALRIALGAGRCRVVTQLVQESALLSLIGGGAGLALALFMDKALIGLLPAGDTPLPLSATPDWRVLAFTIAVAAITGLAFGLAPALQATKPQISATLKDQAGSVVGGQGAGLRKALVAGQVTLSLLLLIAAGLFLQSLRNLRSLNPGFNISNLATFSVDPTLNGYKSERSLDYYRRLSDRLSATPGVASVALARMPLLTGREWDSTVSVEGYTAKQGEWVDPHMQFVSPGYFETLGIPLTLGRDFKRSDEKDAPQVGIINEKFAQRYFGARNPLGRHLGMGGNPGTKLDIEIVGVVKDTKYEGMRDEVPYQFYRPYRQVEFVQEMHAYVRGRGNVENLFPPLRRMLRELDPNVPVHGMRTVAEQADRSLITERMLASLSAMFGCLATFLAAIGLYGVMAYTVGRRTREIGIRVALGASSGSVIRLVMREALLLAGTGIVIGSAAAAALTRLLKAQLFGIAPLDPATMILAASGIAGVAVLAGYLPARRASCIDPMRALHWE